MRSLFRRFPSIVFKKSYWCGPCKAWHITGTPPPSARRRRVKH